MVFFLTGKCVLRWLEIPSVYDIESDELYELDDEGFGFLKGCSSEEGMDAPHNDFTDFCLREEILTTQQVVPKRSVVAPSPSPSLRYLELQITNRCNLRCRHCYIGDSGTNELSLDEMRAILSEFEAMQGLRVLITGGEPLLHSNFAALNGMLPEFLLRKVLFTNGMLLGKKIIEELRVHEIQISVDGLEKAHDSLRGEGSFSAALASIRACREQGLDVSVATMVHARNLGDFGAMQRLFDELGVKDWTVDVPCRTGRLESNGDFLVDPAVGGKYLAYGRGEGIHTSTPGFACGLHLMSVNAKGKVSKCTFFSDHAVGTVRDGLKSSWEKIIPVRLDALKCDCLHVAECRGGCRYRAGLLDSPFGRDPYRCAFYGYRPYDIMKS